MKKFWGILIFIGLIIWGWKVILIVLGIMLYIIREFWDYILIAIVWFICTAIGALILNWNKDNKK